MSAEDGKPAAGEVFEKATGRPAPSSPEPDPEVTGERTEVRIASGPDAIRTLRKAIGERGLLKDVYVSDGELMHLEHVSGTATATGAADEDAPLPLAASRVTPPLLTALLAEQAFVYQLKSRRGHKGESELLPEEVTPQGAAMAAVLSMKSWPKIPAFRGIVGAPILRPDGTLLQREGYDAATGLVLAPRVNLPAVPDAPTPAQVAESRSFLLDRFLRDFIWVDAKADRANYVALLVTPILSSFVRGLAPLGVITATQPGSGKTILTAGPGLLYGQRVMPWPFSEEEMDKVITSVIQDAGRVVVWDNLPEGTVIDSAKLAGLLTANEWTGRILGSSKTGTFPNLKLWLCTGNQLQLGGDLPSRAVLVRLNPDMPEPEKRAGFAIDDLPNWITVGVNQRQLLHHVLVLIVAWTRAGAPRAEEFRMRQFTAWAQAVGGFLEFVDIPGFLGNQSETRAIDEDEARWSAFLTRWRDRHRDRRLTATQLRKDGEPTFTPPQGEYDPWDGSFITTQAGRLPNPIGLGRMLTGQVGRWRGEHVLRSAPGERGDRATFWVETKADQLAKQVAP